MESPKHLCYRLKVTLFYLSVFVVGYCNLFTTVSVINTYHVRTSCPFGDERPVIIWWITILRLGVSFSVRVRIVVRPMCT